MNIQPVGVPVSPRVEDRPTQPAAPADATETAGKSKLADGVEPSREDVSAAVKKMNDAMLGSSQSLQFSIDEDSKDIVVKVIDQSTKEVVRQIPSKEALQIAKSIDKMQQGLLIDQTA
ncbi:flagellar protein FlaG [Telluria mixta]|jgi:flagellar protein FlaG|uniref:Flagellar protein FlaG n=1 Tax=Telluria mixta TaxID=34071 RepID=A0ABT2C5N4_9BURK|nr:flagellar protein FlaG [Telluria mixta]MCS0632684.1 flagellar protein FlaG [Telluria mixta]WEM99021.1 flagellar protein FlaG [Telluria mixta]